jgi:glycosyltransferase involved in cell wall biosynthesis
MVSAPKPKVLIVSGLQIYPTESGGQLRTGALADHLAELGFPVTIFSLVGRKPDYLAGKRSETVPVGPGLTEHVHRGRISALIQLVFYRLHLPPFWISWFLGLFLPRRLRDLLEESDRVIADFPFLAAAPIKAKKAYWLSTHNVEANLLRSKWQRSLMRRMEKRAAERAQGLICCSRDDQEAFARLVPGKPSVYVPNGLRDDRFKHLEGARGAVRQELGIGHDQRVLLFTASVFAPNVEALHDFLIPCVRRHQALLQERRLHVLVVGSVSKTGWREPHLTVTGKVEKIEPYFAAADFALNATLRGSGTNVKMGEYMAAGLPILTSAAGLRGYDLTPGQDCIVFDERNFSQVLRETWLFDDPERARAMAESAYRKNRQVVSMSAAILPLAEALEGVP